MEDAIPDGAEACNHLLISVIEGQLRREQRVAQPGQAAGLTLLLPG